MDAWTRPRARGILATLAVAASVMAGPVVAQSPSGGQIGGNVSLLGPWGGDQVAMLDAVLAPFEERTGITVDYVGSQDIVNLLRTGVETGTQPDVADLPSPGILREYASSGALIALDDVIEAATYREQTSPGVVEIGVVDDGLYGISFAGSIKGLIWYDPAVYQDGPPASWDDLAAKAATAATGAGADTKPWCVAVGSDAATGWPATDWIEDFLLRQSGPEVYDQWVDGTLKWSSPEVRRAFESYGSVVAPDAVYGGATTVLTTPFGNGGDPLFTDPPGCVFHHQASWAPVLFGQNAGAQPGDYDFYPFPDIDPAYAGSVVGAGDYMAMFRDTPQARALMAYLATAEAQSLWVGQGGGLSGNRTVTNYPDPLQERAGEVLANAKIFRFDGSDLMPQEMLQAFWKGVLDYTKDLSTLDQVLAELDGAQATAYGG